MRVEATARRAERGERVEAKGREDEVPCGGHQDGFFCSSSFLCGASKSANCPGCATRGYLSAPCPERAIGKAKVPVACSNVNTCFTCVVES